MDKTLQARFLSQLAKAPERRTVGFYHFDGELSWLTYEQLYDQARRYAAWLADHGVRQGDVCILLLASGEFSAMVLVGTLLLGAVPLLMAPPSLPGEYTNHARILNRIIRRTQARVVVTDRSMAKLRDELSPASRRTRFLFEGDAEAAVMTAGTLACAPRNTDIAALQLTSGTTGFPRICVWRQENVVAALDGMAKAMKLRDDDLCLNWTPLYHDMGLVNNFFLCLATGVPLVMLSPLDFVKKPARWLRALSDTGATVTWSPNFGFAITAQRVRADELKGVRLDKVRAFWNAAERIHFETMLAFHRQFEPYGVRFAALKTNFGCAENVGGATFSDPEGTFLVEQVDADLLYEAGVAERIEDSTKPVRTVSIVGVGRPCPSMTVKILSKTGRPLPDGHVGEVALDTPSRMVGYLGDARASRRTLNGSLLRTGDLGYLRGDELFWVGRVRERLTVHGRKLDPSDFEPILLNIAGLRHGCFAAFGVDDAQRGTQRVVIVAEVQDSTERDYLEISHDIREHVLRQLGIAVDDVLLVRQRTLTKTSSGKRRHRAYRQMYLDGELARLQVAKPAP